MKNKMLKGLMIIAMTGLLVGCNQKNSEGEDQVVANETQLTNVETKIESQNLEEITVTNLNSEQELPLILKNHMNATIIVGDDQDEMKKIEDELEEIKTIKVKTFTPERIEAEELMEAYQIKTPNFIVTINNNTDEVYKITYPKELDQKQLEEIKEVINIIMNS